MAQTKDTTKVVIPTRQQRLRIARKLRQAGRVPENKIHVIQWKNKWQLVQEGKRNPLDSFSDKQTAATEARKHLENGAIQFVVVHAADGSVEERLSESM